MVFQISFSSPAGEKIIILSMATIELCLEEWVGRKKDRQPWKTAFHHYCLRYSAKMMTLKHWCFLLWCKNIIAAFFLCIWFSSCYSFEINRQMLKLLLVCVTLRNQKCVFYYVDFKTLMGIHQIFKVESHE